LLKLHVILTNKNKWFNSNDTSEKISTITTKQLLRQNPVLVSLMTTEQKV